MLNYSFFLPFTGFLLGIALAFFLKKPGSLTIGHMIFLILGWGITTLFATPFFSLNWSLPLIGIFGGGVTVLTLRNAEKQMLNRQQ